MSVDNQITVTIIPPDRLLLSMAIRYDHGLGIPGYYDTLFGEGQHQKRLNSALTVMRQLHEEVVGKGFYHVGYEPPMPLSHYDTKAHKGTLQPEEITECIESACSSLCRADEPCSLTATGDCCIRKNRPEPQSLANWQVNSMRFLAKQLRKRGDDLSTDAASWLEKFSGQLDVAKT